MWRLYEDCESCALLEPARLGRCDVSRHSEKEIALSREVERLQVQLAACGVAALGGTRKTARKYSYGWSPAYQDTLNLRRDYDALVEAFKLLHAPVSQEGAR